MDSSSSKLQQQQWQAGAAAAAACSSSMQPLSRAVSALRTSTGQPLYQECWVRHQVGATADGGMLAATCTDTAVLCGSHGAACWPRYGAGRAHGRLLFRVVLPLPFAAKTMLFLAVLLGMATSQLRLETPRSATSRDFALHCTPCKPRQPDGPPPPAAATATATTTTTRRRRRPPCS